MGKIELMVLPHDEFTGTLRAREAEYQITLSPDNLERLAQYYQLISRWNPRLHLVAPCSPADFATRHVLESLLMLPHLPAKSRIADIGSGGGLPIIPCLILRPDLSATLIEASKKKAVFLREALSATGTSDQTVVVADRFESIQAPAVEFVTSRALEKFNEMLPEIKDWAPTGSKLLLFGGESLARELDRQCTKYDRVLLTGSERRFLFLTH